MDTNDRFPATRFAALVLTSAVALSCGTLVGCNRTSPPSHDQATPATTSSSTDTGSNMAGGGAGARTGNPDSPPQSTGGPSSGGAMGGAPSATSDAGQQSKQPASGHSAEVVPASPQPTPAPTK